MYLSIGKEVDGYKNPLLVQEIVSMANFSFIGNPITVLQDSIKSVDRILWWESINFYPPSYFQSVLFSNKIFAEKELILELRRLSSTVISILLNTEHSRNPHTSNMTTVLI